jgi:hypothetical protein
MHDPRQLLYLVDVGAETLVVYSCIIGAVIAAILAGWLIHWLLMRI